MSIPIFELPDKAIRLPLKLNLLYGGCGRVVKGAGHKAKRFVLQCINGVGLNPVEGKQKSCQLKNLILTLLGFIKLYGTKS